MLYLKYPEAFRSTDLGLRLNPEYRGVSDILNGASGGEVYLGFSNSKEYWNQDLMLSKETWAQFGRILYSENSHVLKMVQEIFPDTYKEIIGILERMIK